MAFTGCAIELRTNHRAESQVIVDSATYISNKTFPMFDRDKLILRRLPECLPGAGGNDYLAQGRWITINLIDIGFKIVQNLL